LGDHTASFFHNTHRHAVTLAKEQNTQRRHGHLLKTNGTAVPSASANHAALCSTVWGHGVFASHICLGNTSFNKLLSVCRDPHHLVRDSGLRIEVKFKNDWHLLGVPSLFDMGIDDARWIYKTPQGVLEVATRASGDQISFAAFVHDNLHDNSHDSTPVTLRLTAHVVLGDREHEKPGTFESNLATGRFTFHPVSDTLMHGAYPNASFHWTFDDPSQLAALGQIDDLPWATATSKPTTQLRFSMGGSLNVAASNDISNTSPASSTGAIAPPRLAADGPAAALADALPWFEHCASIHLTAPHGLEQYGGAAWGVRDVCQGPMEWLLATGDLDNARAILLNVFANQRSHSGLWPQWYMHPPFAQIASDHAHGDVPFWPILATAQYLETSNDFDLLDQPVPYFDSATHAPTDACPTVREHLERALAAVADACLPGTTLPAYGHGDWNDSLQPADPSLASRMASGWTAGLYHMALRRYAAALEHHGDTQRAQQLNAQADRVRDDFHKHIMADGIAAGFYVQGNGPDHLLHPRDTTTGVQYRLLPMIRGVLSELFTPDQAASHLALIKQHLLAPDGARLMDHPPVYRGGPTTHFQRSESASFFGREVGIMYVHAHLRYAQTLATLGDADGFYQALLTVCPVALQDTVPNANPRQANLYFSSSDAQVADRYDAAARYDALMSGDATVDGGWRLYSSGPGIYVGLVVQHLLGLRRRFNELIVDPQMPASLDGLTATLTLAGVPVTATFQQTAAPGLTVNAQALTPLGQEPNPYRTGGSRYDLQLFQAALQPKNNTIVVSF
ncbi:MAG: amylo-alpha-1,6-glucosidase, partial [Algisphaera sp.]